jgi:hypothetical protein
MKRFLLFVLYVFAMYFTAHAQSTFKLLETKYVGALETNASNDWTQGWTNFDPKNTIYGTVTDDVTLNAMLTPGAKQGLKEITTTVTLDASKIYALRGIVVVKSGGTLIIPAGTTIRGLADVSATPNKNYAVLLIDRGGKIEVNGTAQKPVVMTSLKEAGSRERGDWGGLVMCGNAKNNQATTAAGIQLEGFNNITFDNTLGFHGGSNDNDNSGSIKYLRVEFPGLAFEANKEVNGITLGSIGRGTEFNHIQVSYSNDDSYEWFGGTVNGSHLIAWKTTDDDFDTDFGYSGLNQFGIAVKDTSYYDLTYSAASGASTSEGFESDNDASGSGRLPYTNAVFSNFTMIGPVPVGRTHSQLSSVGKAAFRRGARIRRNSSIRVVNSIFMGYRNFLMIDGDSCLRNTNNAAALALLAAPLNTPVDVLSKQIMFSNNLIVNSAAALSPASATANGLVEVSAADRLAPINEWVKVSGLLSNKVDPVAYTDKTVLENPSAYTISPDFKPVSSSPALTGANFKDNPILKNLYISTAAKDLTLLKATTPVYPNPISGGDLQFGHKVESYGIFDMNGKLVSHGFDTDHATVNDIAKGIYFIKLDGKVQKIVIE